MGIDIKIDNEEECSIVHVAGKIDATTCDELEDVFMDLLADGKDKIILELENASYISSAGLRVLLIVSKELYESGCFCLCNINGDLMEIIEMAGFNTFINVYEDLDEARNKIAEE